MLTLRPSQKMLGQAPNADQLSDDDWARCGVFELQRCGCFDPQVQRGDPIAASLKLDSSHIRPALF